MATAGILLGCCCGGGGVSCCADATLTATFTLSAKANTIHFNDTVCSEQYGSLACISGSLPALNTGANYILNQRNAVTLNNTLFNQTINLVRIGGAGLHLPGVDPWCYYVGLHPNNGTNVCSPTPASGSVLAPFGGYIYQLDPSSGQNQPFNQYTIIYYATPYFDTISGTTRWEAGVKVVLANPAGFPFAGAQFHIGSIASNVNGCPSGLTYIPSGNTKSVDTYHGYCCARANGWNCFANSNISTRGSDWVQYSIAQPTLLVTI